MIAAASVDRILDTRGVVHFADREAVMASLLTGSSNNRNVDYLPHQVFRTEKKIVACCRLRGLRASPTLLTFFGQFPEFLFGSQDRKRVKVMEVCVSAAQNTGGDSAAKD